MGSKRWSQSTRDPYYIATFSENNLPFKDFNKVNFLNIKEQDIINACATVRTDLLEIFDMRVRSNMMYNIPTYPWQLSNDYSYNCLYEALDCHFEIEQCLHWCTGRRQSLTQLDDDLVTWIIFKARDFAFYHGTEILKSIFENDNSICDCRERTKLRFWNAATYVAMHSGRKVNALQDRFISNIKTDIIENATISYFWAMFEDFRAHFGLVERGQIIGSFVVLVNGKAVFSPPIEDVTLANKLRAKFGRPSVEDYRKECERHLKDGTCPWERWSQA